MDVESAEKVMMIPKISQTVHSNSHSLRKIWSFFPNHLAWYPLFSKQIIISLMPIITLVCRMRLITENTIQLLEYLWPPFNTHQSDKNTVINNTFFLSFFNFLYGNRNLVFYLSHLRKYRFISHEYMSTGGFLIHTFHVFFFCIKWVGVKIS